MRFFARSLAGVALGGAALGTVGERKTAQAATKREPIVGVWLVSPAPGSEFPFLFFYVFHEDGILTHAGPLCRPTDRAHDPEHVLEYTSGGRGTWMRTGPNEYAYFEIDIDYDQAGNPITLDEVTGAIIYDPTHDRWTGSLVVQETDIDGTPTGATFPMEMVGRRVAVRP